MKHRLPLAALLLIPLVAGCALFQKNGPAEDKVAALEKTFASTVSALTQLRAEGKVSDGDWTNIKQISEGVNATFISLHNDLDAGKTVDTDAVLNGIRASLSQLSTYESEARRATRRVATPARRAGPVGDAGQEQVHARAA